VLAPAGQREARHETGHAVPRRGRAAPGAGADDASHGHEHSVVAAEPRVRLVYRHGQLLVVVGELGHLPLRREMKMMTKDSLFIRSRFS